MAPQKRAPASDYDSDSGFVADAPRSKKSKTTALKGVGKENATRKEKNNGDANGNEGSGGGLEMKKGKVDGEEFWGVSFI